MPNRASPDADPPTRPAELRQASAWPARHGLTDDRPTPLLAARLAARRRARLADHAILAVLIIAAALAQAYDRLATSPFGGEDARELTRPSVAWALPMVLLFGSAPAWWNAAALGFVILGLIALFLIQARTPPIATVARQAMGTR